MPEFDLQIRNGTIVDGTQTPRYQGDVWIKDGRIAQIGGKAPGEARRVIDASGCVVAPGFVDLHTHYDAQIRWDPWCTISGWHGVTSVVLGNCGFGFAPVRAGLPRALDADDDAHRGDPLSSRWKRGMPWDWETIPEYLDCLERAPKGVNVHPVHADRVAHDLRDGPRGGEDAAGDAGRAQGDAAPAARGHGRRAVRLLHPAPRARTRCRPTSTARRW